ncbi:glycosyl transferase family 2 [Arthrobacter sp. SLBN-83]|uniref:glycosyltransferase family 2 protein n=1 Tax=Arthrobacter sp. SLBN-83 TaxID=2768449 RepID=UPI00115497D0|nr:glycosyltransferase [Arthrobacter sp. SLBN-83]TQJ59045.1 glycosyl transferase family 2 [Arthrobacter sp. SLBN-83]
MSAAILPNILAPRRESAAELVRVPTVSVVIPCYNYARFLPAAVQSVLEQDAVNPDIIIVDDASTDNSAHIALKMAGSEPRIRVIRHHTNMGHIATYNDGLCQATGDYVVLLSADDLLAPGSLARSTALMEAHPEVGLVYGFASEFSDAPPPVRPRRTSWTLWSGRQWIQLMFGRGANIIMNPEAVVRRSVLDQLGGYNAGMPHAADMDFWLRAAAISGVGRVNGPVQAYYRVHGGNMHLTDFGAFIDDIRARRQVFEQFASEPGREQARLLEIARRAMAVEATRLALLSLAKDQDGRQDALELADFALETYPYVTDSIIWSWYARCGQKTFRFWLRGYAILDLWRAKVLWRIWRRYGV